MFYKGTLKSYDSVNQIGIIQLSEKDLELNFSLNDFPNSVLEPQIGERVKCLIEEIENKHIAKFIVRLDHKNARTDMPRNNIFYSEEEDLYVLKKAQQEKEDAKKKIEENNVSTDSKQSESDSQTKDKENLQAKKYQEDISTGALQNDLKSSELNLQVKLESDFYEDKKKQAENEKTENSKLSSITAEPYDADDENLVDQQQTVDRVSTTIVNSESGKGVANPVSVESDQAKFMFEEDSSTQTTTTQNSITERTLQEKVAVSTSVLNAEDDIKLHQTLPLSALTQIPSNQPVDVDISGTLDLSHPTELKDFFPTNAPEALVKPSAQSIHLGQAKPIKPTEMSPFEQLQRELGSLHTTSIPDRSSTKLQHTSTKNSQLESVDAHNNDTISNAQKSVETQEAESQLQKVKTPFAYKTHKIKSKKKSTLTFNPWLIMGLFSLGLVVLLGYLGFQKYLQYKDEQEAKARYYLLEQQKVIEDQRKRMAELSEKPLIPQHKRKE